MMVAIPRISGWRKGQIEARTAKGKFMRRELAGKDGSGTAQLTDYLRVCFGNLVKQQL
jgi:hypothetical protein